ESVPAGTSHTDTVSHTIEDTHVTQSTATVTITVNVPAETVNAVADTGSGADDGPLVTGNVLTNDHVDDAFSIVNPGSVITSAHGATVTLDAASHYAHDPKTYSCLESMPAGTSVTETFCYTNEDSHGTQPTAPARRSSDLPAETVNAVADTGSGADDGPLVTGNVLTNDHVDDAFSIVNPGSVITSAHGATVTLDA